MRPRDFKSDKQWSDRFIPEIKRIMGEYLISQAPDEEDMQHNTDLMVFTLGSVRVACRVRQHQYLAHPQYRDEFTIRASRPNGVKTELTKIIEGWGDYILYGFADQDDRHLAAWVLGDLRAFRLAYMRGLYQGTPIGSGKANLDGSSSFLAFRIDDMPDDFVVARKTYSDSVLAFVRGVPA